jgi:hypothetical protein
VLARRVVGNGLPSFTNLQSLSGLRSLDIQDNARLPDCEVRWLANQVGKPDMGLDWVNGGMGNCAGP